MVASLLHVSEKIAADAADALAAAVCHVHRQAFPPHYGSRAGMATGDAPAQVALSVSSDGGKSIPREIQDHCDCATAEPGALPGEVIVDVGGVGYQIFILLNVFYRLPEVGGAVSLYIHTHLRKMRFSCSAFEQPKKSRSFSCLTASPASVQSWP